MRDGTASAWRPPLSADGAMPDAATPERMAWPLASLVIGAASIGLWAMIWAAARATLG